MKKVLIIGGGIAGLAAAAELSDCRVTLLEAKPRFGGRIQTLRSRSSVIELGAEFIHGESKPLLDAIEEAQLAKRAVADSNKVFKAGRMRSAKVWDNFGKLIQKVDPQAKDISFLDFLRQQQEMSKNARRLMLGFVENFNAADAERISAHSLRRAEYSAEQMSGDKQMRLDKGYSALVDFAVVKARQAGATLLNQVMVRSVHWRRGHVEVRVIRGGAPAKVSADAAIITLPLGVLKAGTVLFQPPLLEKGEAIAGLEFGNVVKITLAFQEAWWPERDFGFIHALDELIPTWWSHPRHPILTGWVGGLQADALLFHSPEELEALSLEILTRIFAKSAHAIRAQFVSSHTYNWAQDPLVRGAYSYIPVGGLNLPKQLGEPIDNTLYFAGEATARDAQLGTVFAALESGQRAAREVQEKSAL